MEYAIQLILPIIGGLLLGDWLTRTYGLSPLWTVLLGILGMVMGIRILYKRGMAEQRLQKEKPPLPKKAPSPTQLTPAQTSPAPQTSRAEAKAKENGTPQANEPKQPRQESEQSEQASSPPPAKGTTLDSLHDLYQQIENSPPEEAEDFPPDLDRELNLKDTQDDATDALKLPKSEH
jgi:hypothetical protein